MRAEDRVLVVRNSISDTILFTATLFLSAFLLFLFQPMVGKMLLPWLGGAAGVWTTCVLFFQAMLLAGYVYAHLLSRIPDTRKQVIIHCLILLVPFAFLPIRFNATSSQSGLLVQLLVSAGVPFFSVSATAPLLQSWYVRAKRTSNDPYSLYAASNAGSLLALIAYPLVIEPAIGVSSQNRLWLALYIVLVPILVATASMAWNKSEYVANRSPVIHKPTLKRRLYWTLAAFLPSALMLAVTNHIAADLASVPFLWTIPLAIYLVTFIQAFARRWRVGSATVSQVIPIVLLAMFPLVAADVIIPPGFNWIVIGCHLLVLYSGALLCHTALAKHRPDPQHLTEFYFCIALGGVLGGVFTATLAPLIFNTVFEYPLLMGLLPFFRSAKGARDRTWIPAVFAVTLIATWFALHITGADKNTEALARVHTAFIFVCYSFR